MAFVAGRTSTIFVDQYDLTPYFNSLELSYTDSLIEMSGFNDGGREYMEGARDGTIALQGLFEATNAWGADRRLWGGFNNRFAGVITVSPVATTIGNRAYLGKYRTSRYDLRSPVEGVVTSSAELRVDGTLDGGDFTHAKGAEVAAGQGSAVDNSVATNNGGAASQHIFAIAGGFFNGKIQHSSDDVTYADLIKFDYTGALGAERKEVTGTVNRYTRSDWSGTFTSCTFLHAFARR